MKLRLTILFIVLSLCTSAQFYLGIKAGINSSNQFYTVQTSGSTPSYGYSSSYSSRSSSRVEYLGDGLLNFTPSFQAGYWFRRFIALQTEMSYMSMGFKDKTKPEDNIKISYYQWSPIVVKLMTGNRKNVQFFACFGLNIGIPLSAVFNLPGTQVQNPNDPFQVAQIDKVDILQYVNIDASLFIGGGIAIPAGNGKVEIEGRYIGGFAGVYNGDISNVFGQTINNSNLILQVGYSLLLARPEVLDNSRRPSILNR
jgi:hypothetical protein